MTRPIGGELAVPSSPGSRPVWPTWSCPPRDSLAYAFNFGEIGLTAAILRALEDGPASAGDIVRILDATGAPVITVLKDLERRGRVVRDQGSRPTRWRRPSGAGTSA